MFFPLPKRDAYRGARFYRANLPNALRTVPVTTVPLLQKAGVLPKRFIQPQNKKYRRAVAEQSPAFNFVPVAQFGDEELATKARSALSASWTGKGRFQAASRVVGGRALCLALKYSSNVDGNVYRDVERHVDALEAKCKRLDEKNKVKRNEAAAGAVEPLKKGQLRRSQPAKTPILLSIKNKINELAHIDMAVLDLPPRLSKWPAIASTSSQSRRAVMLDPVVRAADHSILTRRLNPRADARVFFEHAEAPELVQNFLKAHERVGGGSTGRQPIARGIRMAFYLSAVFLHNSGATTSRVEQAVRTAESVSRLYSEQWRAANIDRFNKDATVNWSLGLVEHVAVILNRLASRLEAEYGVSPSQYCALLSDKHRVKTRKKLAGVRAYSKFMIDIVFVVNLALSTGWRPGRFISLELLDESEWEMRRDGRGRRARGETVLVKRFLSHHGKHSWMLHTNGGKGARSSATSKESNALFTIDIISKEPSSLFHLHELCDKVEKAHAILTMDEEGEPVIRQYQDSKQATRTSHSLIVKTRSKHFKFNGAPMQCPPYLRASFADGLDSVSADGEGGAFSTHVTNSLMHIVRSLATTGLETLCRFSLPNVVLRTELGLGPDAIRVLERFAAMEDLRLTIYDIRRARDTAYLSALECAKAWRNLGAPDGQSLVHACEALLAQHLSLTDHSLAVAKRYYCQYGLVESRQFSMDAKRIKKKGFKVPVLSGDRDTFQLYIRNAGWLLLYKWNEEGLVSWEHTKKRK